MCLAFPLFIWFPYKMLQQVRINAMDKSLAIAIAHTSTRQLVANDRELNQILGEPKWYIIYDRLGEVMHRSNTAPELTIDYDALTFDQFAFIEGHRTLAIRRVSHGRAVLVGIPTEVLYQGLPEMLPFFFLGTIVFMATALASGWWAAGKSLAPIQSFTDIARRISQGDHFESIDLAGTEHELRDLGVVLNQAFQRLHYALKQQRNLTADASHELRTPISVILLELESALRKERSPEEYKERLQSALETTEQLKQLVESLMVLARSDAGFDQMNLESCDLAGTCNEVLQLLAPKAREAKITLKGELNPLTAAVDAERLKQVLINLINNGLQYAGPGATIQLSLKSDEKHALINVDDDGSGIPEASQARLFDRFYRADESRSSKQGNLGLGLSICKAIVEAHDGTIEIDTAQTQGAHFIIRLPIKS